MKDYDSPGTAAVVNASQAEVDLGAYDFRAVGSGAVNDTYTIRTAAPTLTQGALTDYQLIDAENAPASYARVFKTSGTSSVFPTVSNNNGAVTDNSDGSKTYSFSGSSGSGYSKSTITFSAGADTGSGSAYIVLKALSNGTFRCARYNDNGVVEIATYSSLNIDYKVSTPPSGGVSGSVTVSPVSTPSLVQYAIKPATVTAATVTEHNSNLTVTYKKLQTTPGSETTKTFLIAQEESYG